MYAASGRTGSPKSGSVYSSNCQRPIVRHWQVNLRFHTIISFYTSSWQCSAAEKHSDLSAWYLLSHSRHGFHRRLHNSHLWYVFVKLMSASRGNQLLYQSIIILSQVTHQGIELQKNFDKETITPHLPRRWICTALLSMDWLWYSRRVVEEQPPQTNHHHFGLISGLQVLQIHQHWQLV